MGRFCVNYCDWRHATRMAAVLSATSSYGALEVGERLVHSGAPGARNAAIVANFLSNGIAILDEAFVVAKHAIFTLEPRMDIHENARTTPRSRMLMIERLAGQLPR